MDLAHNNLPRPASSMAHWNRCRVRS